MRKNIYLVIFLFVGFYAKCWAECLPGVYGDGNYNIIALTEKAWVAKPGLGYLMLDGRFGSTLSLKKPFQCSKDSLQLKLDTGDVIKLARIELSQTATTFTSANTEFSGLLVERLDLKKVKAPLLIMIQGSELESPLGSTRSLLFAASGMRVFVYDRRGVGQSGGFYTQNFELLAEDAAAAMKRARELAQGRYGRSGYFGVSQGGWVAPLAATRTGADYVAVGFGLVASPIEEDLDQMLLEAQHQNLDSESIKQIHRLSQATATIVSSHFNKGFEELDELRRKFSGEAWVKTINGEYSGDMIRMSNEDLIRIGRAVFDNLELIWDYDAESVLRKSKIPLLWIIAEDDREAPSQRTILALQKLKSEGVPIESYIFPDTDHGMYEYLDRSDGSRKMKRVTDGYFRLAADWIQGNEITFMGRARVLEDLNK